MIQFDEHIFSDGLKPPTRITLLRNLHIPSPTAMLKMIVWFYRLVGIFKVSWRVHTFPSKISHQTANIWIVCSNPWCNDPWFRRLRLILCMNLPLSVDTFVYPCKSVTSKKRHLKWLLSKLSFLVHLVFSKHLLSSLKWLSHQVATSQPHTIHVWYIYQHLPYKWTKCR